MQTEIEDGLSVDITDAEMRSIQDAILKRYAVDFHNYEPKSFKRRLLRVYRKFNFTSSFDLWSRTLKDKNFIHEFINEVSVGLTALFRDPEFWQTLQELIKKEIIYQKEIQIWHAGCSSGEEIYTAGIIWEELKITHKVKSMATDISSNALNAAKSGAIIKAKAPEYKRNFLQFNPKGNFDHYFIEDIKNLYVKKEYFSYVNFRNSNLIMDDIANTDIGKYDIVFCRNVLIYFDNQAKTLVIDKIFKALKPGGFLIVGFLDSLVSYLDEDRFEYYNMNQRIFRKRI